MFGTVAFPDMWGNFHRVMRQCVSLGHIHTWVQCMITRVCIASCPGAEVVPLLLARDVSFVYTSLHYHC